MTTHPPRDEPERDPWLSHALRHAPDADAAPAPELSDAILRSARNAVKRPSASASRDGGVAHWWSWLARPPVAAGFATVMVAVLVGLMWIDKPIDEALPSKAEVPAAAPAPSTAPAPASSPETAREAAPTTSPGSTTRQAARAEATDDARSREPKRAAPAPASPQKLAAQRERPADRADANAPVPQPSSPTEPARGAAPPQAAAPAPFNDNAARPAPATEAAGRMSAGERAGPSENLAERRGAADASTARDAARAKSAPAAVAQSQPQPQPQSQALAMRAQGASASTFEAPVLIDALERWQWRLLSQQQAAGEPHAMTAALRNWVEQLHRAARWSQEADAAATNLGEVDTLVLWRDGARYATIEIGAESARLAIPGRPTLVSPLSPAASVRLKSSLAAATR